MTSEKTQALTARFVRFSVRIVRVVEALPKTPTGKHIGGQLLRSGTSAAPNYAEACDAESKADFVHKLKIAIKELRETGVWLAMIVESGLIEPAGKLDSLVIECNELTAILVASVRTARQADS
ncbi:MAG: four helix bundle protein [Verrucomicrobia bacterium]|nr:four helix bundle protein [Verrucomicrobiota bacterium]